MTVLPSILLACIGNIFHGDDAFGVEAAKYLAKRKLPENVKLVDFGIRGFDLAFALVDGYDVTIFVDAMQRGETPGTIYVFEPDLSEIDGPQTNNAMVDTHGLNPMKVLSMAKGMGAEFGRLLVIGCEPETLGGEHGLMGLSRPVEAAVERAVERIVSLIAEINDEYEVKVVAGG
ncbi:MAG: hydrogenase maturation protease [Pyrinomonadaceae bacterium]